MQVDLLLVLDCDVLVAVADVGHLHEEPTQNRFPGMNGVARGGARTNGDLMLM